MAVATSVQKKLEEIQIKIMELGVKEAETKLKKAQVELETAKLTQQHVQNIILKETSSGGVLQ